MFSQDDEIRITYVETALDRGAKRRLSSTGETDILIGLPTYKNTRTIGNVVSCLASGVAENFPGRSAHILLSDGGSTDDTVDLARRVTLPPGITMSAIEYQGVTGKGSAIRAILEAAELLDVAACAIVDADLRSITPAWIERLVTPILEDRADFVSPVYSRDRHEVTINDMIAYPLTRALYGLDIRQPLGGELAMSPVAWRAFNAKDVWETDVARFGIHIWMISQAINNGWRLMQANLGTKTHDYKDPTVGFEPKFLQIVGTMFRMMSFYRRVWPEITGVQKIEAYGNPKRLDPVPVPTTRQTLWDSFLKGLKRYRRNLSQILNADQLAMIADLSTGEREDFPPEEWARIVMEFAVVYNRGEGDPDKVALAMLPLYYARKATLLRELEGRPWTAVEDAIHAQADAFVQSKPTLVSRWASYVPWQAPIG